MDDALLAEGLEFANRHIAFSTRRRVDEVLSSGDASAIQQELAESRHTRDVMFGLEVNIRVRRANLPDDTCPHAEDVLRRILRQVVFARGVLDEAVERLDAARTHFSKSETFSR